jgi:hypothetical protein
MASFTWSIFLGPSMMDLLRCGTRHEQIVHQHILQLCKNNSTMLCQRISIQQKAKLLI